MTQYKRGNRWWMQISFNGEVIRKASPNNSKQGARDYELFIRQKLARGEPLSEPKVVIKHLFKDVVLQWLDVSVRNNNKHSEFVNRGYAIHRDLIPFFGKKQVDEISSYDVEQYKIYLLKERSLSPKSINNQLSFLSKCLKTAIEWKYMETLPIIKLLKVPPQKYDYLTPEESKLLVSTATGYWHEMILLGLQAGLRFGEIIGLKWENVNLEECLLKVTQTIVRGIETSPKNNKIRTIPLTQDVKQMFEAKSKIGKYIFERDDNKILQSYYCLRNLHRICKQAGMRNVGWHTLRHTFATRLAERKVPINSVQQLLGHSDIKTTMRYVHINFSALESSIKVLGVIV